MRTEPWLLKPHKTKEVLQSHGFQFRKKFGQNFLLDAHVLDKIIAAAEISASDFVLEIGPGIGTLTQYLCYYGGDVTAIEIDRNLIPILSETLADWDNVSVVEGDVMKLNLAELIHERSGGRPVKVVANLPYYITTPIIMKLLEERLPITSITVMVQTEVAERMEAQPGSAAYGALSLAVQYYTAPKIKAYVPPNCFIPRPKVGSSVITLQKQQERPQVSDENLMFLLIRAAFGQRRKTLANAIKNAAEIRDYLGKYGISPDRAYVEQILMDCGCTLTIRGEALGLSEFIRLTDRIAEDMKC